MYNFSYKQFQMLFTRLVSELKSNQNKVGLTFSEVTKLTKENLASLHQVLDSSFIERPVNKSPNLRYWTKEDVVLKDTPVQGEQDLFNNIVDYLFDYYKLPKSSKVVDDLFKKAQDDPNNILLQETYYEINQLFSAFGHSSASNMQNDRLVKLMRYKDPKIFKADLKVMYEAVSLVAAESAQHVTVIDNVHKSLDNPFQEKGDRNVGTPYWFKTSTRLNGVRVEELSFDLANNLYHKYSKDKNFSLKTSAIPATLFGRNSTKGVVTTYKDNQFIIKNYEASARVIYGVSLVANTNIARLYYSVLQNMKNQPTFSTLRGTPYLRELLPKIAAFDSKHGSYRESTDKSRYDTTISVELMVLAAICDILAFGHTSKIREVIITSLFVDALTPIYYKEKARGPIKVLYTFGGHKSGFYNTLRWGSQFGNIISKYTKLILDRQWFYKTYRLYANNSVPMDMFQGDDWSSVFKNKSMALAASEIEEKHFGLISNHDKSAFGTWIVQNGVNSLGKVSYPLARALRSFYYPERTTQNKPPFVLLMTAYSAIENLWESPHLDYFIKEHLLKTDKFKGGTRNDKGDKINFDQFYQIYRKQAQDYGEGKIFNSNDPRWEGILDKSSGSVKSEWLLKIWNKIESLAR